MEDTQNIQRLCIIGPSDRDDIQNQNEPNRYSEIVSLIENFFQLEVLFSKTGNEYKHYEDVLFTIKEFNFFRFRDFENCKFISFQGLRILYQHRQSLPRFKPSRPVYCFSMKDMSFAVSGFQNHDVRKAVDLIHYMSGHVKRNFKPELYLIAKSAKSEDYRSAVASSKKVLTMEWLTECWERRDDIQFRATDPQLMEEFSLKCFGGLSLYFYGFADNEIEDLRNLTIEKGADFVTNINHATHIVFDNDSLTRISKEQMFQKGASSEVCFVTTQWFWKSIQLDYCYDEDLFYAFNKGETKLRTGRRTSGTVSRKRKSKGSSRSALDNSNISGNSELMYSTDSINVGFTHPTKHNDKRYQVCVEMFDTEKNYCNSLELMINMFKEPLEMTLNDENHHPIISKCEIAMIFGKILPILNVHRNILNSLKLMMDNWDSNYYDVKIGYVWAMHGPELGAVYPPFVNSYEETRQTLNLCLQREKFLSFVKTVEGDPACRKITLKDMLIKPVQRLPSVVLLLNEILKRTDVKHQDFVCLKKAIEEIESVLRSTNNSKQRNEQFKEFLNATNDICGFPPELVNSSRQFKMKVDVFVINGDGMFDHYRGRILTLFLFNDMVMFTKNRLPLGSNPNLSQSFIQNTRGTLSRNMSFLRPKSSQDKKPYKLVQTFRNVDFRVVRYERSREIVMLKIRDIEDGDLLFVGNSPNENFRELMHFMNQLCNLVTSENGKDLKMEELTTNIINERIDEDEDYRAVKKAMDILHNERPEHDRRRSSLRRAMSNISLNITHGIQKFTSRANLSFINENSSL